MKGRGLLQKNADMCTITSRTNPSTPSSYRIDGTAVFFLQWLNTLQGRDSFLFLCELIDLDVSTAIHSYNLSRSGHQSFKRKVSFIIFCRCRIPNTNRAAIDTSSILGCRRQSGHLWEGKERYDPTPQPLGFVVDDWASSRSHPFQATPQRWFHLQSQIIPPF